MGGRGSSSGVKGISAGLSGKNVLSDYIDSEQLTKKQIDTINLQRSDVFRSASQFMKETKKPQEVELTNTQSTLYYKAKDGDFSGFSSASAKTLEAVKKKAELDYYKANAIIFKSDYDVRNDYIRRPGKKPREASTYDSFVEGYKNRKITARIINEASEALVKKGKDPYKFGREITSSTYKRIQSRNKKDIDNRFKNR